MDLSVLTGAIDLSGVGTAILSVAGSMVTIVAGTWGVKKVLAFFGR